MVVQLQLAGWQEGQGYGRIAVTGGHMLIKHMQQQANLREGLLGSLEMNGFSSL